MELMGSEIKLESELGKGTKFTIELRVRAPPERIPLPELQISSESAIMKSGEL